MAKFKLLRPGAAAKQVQAAFTQEIFSLLTQVGKKTTPKVSTLIGEAVRQSNVYRDIKYELGGELGFLDGQQRIDQIIDVIEKQVYFDVVKKKDGATLYLKAVKENYDEIMADPLAWFITEKGTRLEWLRWLLEEGTTDVIVGYHYTRGNTDRTFGRSRKYGRTGFSRTGYGLMHPQGSYYIDYKYAGDAYDNFIIRAMQTIEDEVQRVLIGEAKRL